MTAKFPPELQGEITTRLLAFNADLRVVFSLEHVDLPGAELESLLAAVYATGYADGAKETDSYLDGGEPPALLQALDRT